MRAVFKPAEADKIIISGADINEISLISQFVNRGKNASIEAEARYDFNNEIDGLVIKIGPKINTGIPVEEDPIYLPFVDFHQRNDANRLFKLDFEVDNGGGYYIFKHDRELFLELKKQIENLGISNVEIDCKFDIIGINNTGGSIFSKITIPRGLFRMINKNDGKTNYYSDEFEIELRG